MAPGHCLRWLKLEPLEEIPKATWFLVPLVDGRRKGKGEGGHQVHGMLLELIRGVDCNIFVCDNVFLVIRKVDACRKVHWKGCSCLLGSLYLRLLCVVPTAKRFVFWFAPDEGFSAENLLCFIHMFSLVLSRTKRPLNSSLFCFISLCVFRFIEAGAIWDGIPVIVTIWTTTLSHYYHARASFDHVIMSR